MKPSRLAWAFCLLLLLLIIVLPTLQGVASPSQPTWENQLSLASTGNSVSLTEIQPGNYCLECHSRGDERLLHATDWRGSIASETSSACPAIRTIHEELNYTERLFQAVDLSRQALPGYMNVTKIDSRTAASSQEYRRLLDQPVTSLDAFQSQAQLARYRLGKVYNDLVLMNEQVKRQKVLLVAGLVSLAVLACLAWGLQNSRFQLAHPELRRWLKLPQWVVIAAVFIFFALPIFQTPYPETPTTTEEQAFQTSLDTTQRAAQASDRALARAWMIARIGATWQALNPEQAAQAFNTAVTAEGEARKNASALWGQALAAQEAAAGSEAFLAKAGLAAGQVTASRERAWALRLMAEEWLPVDKEKAGQFLQSALEVIQLASPAYRDLDLRAIAVTWAFIDPVQALQLVNQVGDPALRSWGLREIAVLTKDSQVIPLAIEAARQVTNPIRRSQALSQVALLPGQSALFQEAYQSLVGQSGAPAAYALSALSILAGDMTQLVNLDGHLYPDALALALLHLGRYEESWQAAQTIADRYEQARAQSAIAAAWAQTDPQRAAEAAGEITVPVLRDRAFLAVLSQSGDATYLEAIKGSYDRVFALTVLGRYSEAESEAANLSEKYPLVSLAIEWSKTDWKSALKLVDAMDQEADKAQALIAIAGVSRDPDVFAQALGMAEAARVRGDALAPAQASLVLAQMLITNPEQAKVAFEQAYETAQRISTK